MPILYHHSRVILQLPPWASTTLATLLWPPLVLLAAPLLALYFTTSYLFTHLFTFTTAKTPPATLNALLQHISVNVLWRILSIGQLQLVRYPDPLAAAVSPAAMAAHGHLADVHTRLVPGIPPSVPRLPVLAKPVQPKDVPVFAAVPRGSEPWRKAARGEKAVLYFVGGGYVRGHPMESRVPWDIVRVTGKRLFAVNYRKACDDASAWPGPLLDALAGWSFLVDELGFAPRSIAVVGGSAGSHLSLALVRYLDDLQQQGWKRWGLPAGLCLSAPWADVSGSYPSRRTNRNKDWLIDLESVTVPSVFRHYDSLTSAYISPARVPASDKHFKRLAISGMPVYVDAGTDEIFYDEICALVAAMGRGGLEVEFLELPGAVHVDYALYGVKPHLWPNMGETWHPIFEGYLRFFDKAWGQS